MSESNHKWCIGCSPDNCSGCGGEPLTKALKQSFEQSVTDPENQPSQYGTVTLEMYETELRKTAELEAALKVARDALDHARVFIRNGIGLGYIRMPDDDCPDTAKLVPGKIFEALAKINEVLHD